MLSIETNLSLTAAGRQTRPAPPVARAVQVGTTANSPLTGVLLSAVTSFGGPATVTGIAGGSIGSGFTLASGASLVVDADGLFVYDPSGAFDGLEPGTFAEERIAYTVSNPLGEASADLVIRIAAADTSAALVLNALGDTELAPGVPATVDPTGDFLAPGLANWEARDLPLGLAIDAATGVISGTPTFGGERRTVTVSASDGGTTYESTLTIATTGGFAEWGRGAFAGPTQADRFADADAEPGGDGLSMASAFRSVQDALDDLGGAGGVVAIRGRFREQVALPSGTAMRSVVLTAHGTDAAVITGAEVLSGLTRCTSAAEAGGSANFAQIFTTTVPESLFDIANAAEAQARPLAYNVLEAGRFCPMATYRAEGVTDTGLFELFSWTEMFDAPGGFDPAGEIVSPDLIGVDQTGLERCAFLLARTGEAETNHVRIDTCDPVTGRITFSDTNWQGGPSRPVWDEPAKHQFAIINNPVDLRPGQWAFDPATIGTGSGQVRLWLWPRDEANVAGGIEISVRDQCVIVADHTRIEGVHLTQAAGTGPLGGAAIASLRPEAVKDVAVRSCRIDQVCNPTGAGRGAIALYRADDVVIERNTIGRIGGVLPAIELGGDLSDPVAAMAEYRVGALARFCARSVIRQNLIDLVTGTPLRLAGAVDCVVADNRIARQTGLGGPLADLGGHGAHIVIARNFVSDCAGGIRASGLSDLSMFGNVLGAKARGAERADFLLLYDTPDGESAEDGGTHRVFNNVLVYETALQAGAPNMAVGAQPPRVGSGPLPAGTGWTWAVARNLIGVRAVGSTTEEARVASRDNVYLGAQPALGPGDVQSAVAAVFGPDPRAAGFEPLEGGPADLVPGAGGPDVPALPAGIVALAEDLVLETDIEGMPVDWSRTVGALARPGVVPQWLIATGIWNDTGVWSDTGAWVDAA